MKKIKIHPVFRKRYGEKAFAKKIRGRLFIDADRSWVESLFGTESDPKKGTLRVFRADKVTTKKDAKRLARIGKEIKKQGPRVKIVNLLAALGCVVGLAAAVAAFRNPLARLAVTRSLEGAFGARCDLATIDLDIAGARFSLSGLSVANRDEPMRNLFEVGELDLDFSLLELSRGKLVAENIKATGIRWGTARKTSGALPPRRAKAFEEKRKNAKPNPALAAVMAEVDRVKSEVSVGSGIGAVKDQLDPMKMIEREKDALKSPALAEKISKTVPDLTEKWQGKTSEAKTAVSAALASSKRVRELKPASIKTLPEAQKAIQDIQAALADTKKALDLAESTSKGLSSDAATVADLKKKADEAWKADSARLKELVSSAKGFSFETGKDIVSGIIKTFATNALGSYYPYLDKGLSALRALRAGSGPGSKAAKEASLASRAKATSRIPGRTLTFGKASAPSLWLKRIELEAADKAAGISGSAIVSNVTNDADRVGKPIGAKLNASHGKFSEAVDGAIDLRSKAERLVDARFSVSGLSVDVAPSDSGVPGMRGALRARGTVAVAANEDATIGAGLSLTGARLSSKPFEPKAVSNAYAKALAGIDALDATVTARVPRSGELDVSVSTDADAQVARAVKAEASRYLNGIQSDATKKADAYLADVRSGYLKDLDRFGVVSSDSAKALSDIRSNQKALDAKKAEMEKRAKELAGAQIEKAGGDAAKKATKDIKKLLP